MENRRELTPDELDRISGGTGGSSGEERQWTVRYTVSAGDTLRIIANRFNTTVEEIMQKNHLANERLIKKGDTLILPE